MKTSVRKTMKRTVTIWGLLAVALTVVTCSTVPITGRRSFNVIPEQQAIALGADSYQQVLGQSKVIQSGPGHDQVVRVGRRIAEIADDPGYEWEFNLIDDPTVNAFCLPGGKVAVYTGILPVAGSDAGLAVVMAHEIAHAIARHGSERMTNDLALQIGQVGLDVLLGQKSEQTRSLVLAAYGAGATVGVMLPFGRSQESEADRIGLVYMARAGYDPHEAPRFWERMMAASSGGGPPEFLSTHPSPDTRIRDLNSWIPDAMKEYRPR